jgi:transposase
VLRRRHAASRSEKKAGRRAGKQPGAPGARLEPVVDPDEVVEHAPTECDACGGGLGGGEDTGVESRQVFDLPPRRVHVREHRVHRRRCGCGHTTVGSFPPEATAPTCWGPEVRAVAVYLLVRHHLPVARVAEILSDLVGAPVSTGWVGGINVEAAGRLGGFLAELADRVAAADVVHVDETGARVSGIKHWFHVASTRRFTHLAMHRRRGRQATDDIGILARFEGTLVHDRWAPYWHYDSAGHALCGAHLLRDLAAVAENWVQSGWAEPMAALLVEAKNACDAALAKGHKRLHWRTRHSINERYDTILADAFTVTPADGAKRPVAERIAYNLAVALRDHRHEVLAYTTDLRVPFDNNQAERDLRMVKLQQKISGGFRTPTGAEAFAAVRSYIETGRKHANNPLRPTRRPLRRHPLGHPTTDPLNSYLSIPPLDGHLV